MGNGNEQEKLTKTILSCLFLADRNTWPSIAFPALGTGIFRIPLQMCANAFKDGIGAYVRNRDDSQIENIWFCLTLDAFPVFREVFEVSGSNGVAS
jgi:O-acetyl-ADP-ribose deacetylase (regulator of RNase III)